MALRGPKHEGEIVMREGVVSMTPKQDMSSEFNTDISSDMLRSVAFRHFTQQFTDIESPVIRRAISEVADD